jgi:hypothetical protein
MVLQGNVLDGEDQRCLSNEEEDEDPHGHMMMHK